jgi:hypothetical protein
MHGLDLNPRTSFFMGHGCKTDSIWEEVIWRN